MTTVQTDIETAAQIQRLGPLLERLNRRSYGIDLARWHDAWGWPAVIVHRARTDADVMVAVSVDPETGVYRLAVFTMTAWNGDGDPFMTAERDAMERAARFVLQYVPETPTT